MAQKLEEGTRGRKGLNRSGRMPVGVAPECTRQLCVTMTEYLRKITQEWKVFWIVVPRLQSMTAGSIASGSTAHRTVWPSCSLHGNLEARKEGNWKQNMSLAPNGILPPNRLYLLIVHSANWWWIYQWIKLHPSYLITAQWHFQLEPSFQCIHLWGYV